MKAEYIIEAMSVLDRCAEMLCSSGVSPTEMGRLSAAATMARIHLSVHSGLNDVEIEIEEEDFTDYTMRQGELGNPDRSL